MTKKKPIQIAEAAVIPKPRIEKPVLVKAEPMVPIDSFPEPMVPIDSFPEPMAPIGSFPVGKVFAYDGKIYKKVNILTDGTNRCLLCEARDGGLYTVPGAILNLTPATTISLRRC